MFYTILQDRGSPPRSTNTSVTVLVQDNDDLGPRFTQEVYRTNITEFYPLTVNTQIQYLINISCL